MKVLQIFSFSREKLLALELAARLEKDIPPKFMADGGKKLSVNKITHSLERVYQEALGRYEGGRTMGLVRRAVFANAFKWGLKEKGYSDKFCDMATEGLIVEFARAKKG